MLPRAHDGATAVETGKALEPVRPRGPASFPWYLWLAIGTWTLAAVWTSTGGMAHPEIATYLPYHLSDAPLLERIYNSRLLDDYQARELTYVIDSFDCHVIAWSARLGFPHLLSLNYFLCTFGIVLLLWRFLSADLGLDRVVAFLLVTLYLSAPCVFLSTSYFRSGKVSATLAVMLLIRELHRTLREEGAGHTRWIPFGLAALAAALCDRQGFFIVLVTGGLLAAHYAVRRKPPAARLAGVAFGVVGLQTVYNLVIAPRLTQALNGYWPDMTFQSLPWRRFLENPGIYLYRGADLLLDTGRFLFGNVPEVAAVLLFAAIVIAIAKAHGQLWRNFALVLLASLVAMNAMMVLRHPPVARGDVRRTMYWIPATLLVLALAAVALECGSRRVRPAAIRIALLLVLIANAAALPRHRAIVRTGPSRKYFMLGTALRRALVTKQPGPELAVHPLYVALR